MAHMAHMAHMESNTCASHVQGPPGASAGKFYEIPLKDISLPTHLPMASNALPHVIVNWTALDDSAAGASNDTQQDKREGTVTVDTISSGTPSLSHVHKCCC